MPELDVLVLDPPLHATTINATARRELRITAEGQAPPDTRTIFIFLLQDIYPATGDIYKGCHHPITPKCRKSCYLGGIFFRRGDADERICRW